VEGPSAERRGDPGASWRGFGPCESATAELSAVSDGVPFSVTADNEGPTETAGWVDADHGEWNSRGSDEGASYACGSSVSCEGASHACGPSVPCEGAATEDPASGAWSDWIRGSEEASDASVLASAASGTWSDSVRRSDEASDASVLASTACGARGADEECGTFGARTADESEYGEPLDYTRNKDS